MPPLAGGLRAAILLLPLCVHPTPTLRFIRDVKNRHGRSLGLERVQPFLRPQHCAQIPACPCRDPRSSAPKQNTSVFLSPDGNALSGSDRLCGAGSLLRVRGVGCNSFGARLAVEEAALLHRAAGLDAGDGAVVLRDASAAGAVDGGGQVRDVLGDGVLRAHSAGVDAIALAGLGHGIVARVEVFAVLEVLGEVVGAGRELAVEAEEALLLRGERLGRRHGQRGCSLSE